MQQDGDRAADEALDANFIGEPRHPKLQQFFAYWQKQRGERLMPSRADIDPIDIPKLLPNILMYNVDGPGAYTVRLVGEAVQSFVGKNMTGRPAGSTMEPRSARTMIHILDAIVAERAPKFRLGKAHWHQDKAHRNFEACFLPLSADGATVNIIFGVCVFTE